MLAFACGKSQPPENRPTPSLEMPSHSAIPDPRRNVSADEITRTSPEMERALTDRYGSDENKKRDVRAALAQADRTIELEKNLDAENQRDLVLPRRPDFVPAPSDRKGSLRVILSKQKIRPGELLRFRLELENVGRKPFDYREFKPSIFKSGGLDDSDFMHFFVVDPHGETHELIPAAASDKLHTKPVRSPRMVEMRPPNTHGESGPHIADSLLGNDASNHFLIHLEPGETLRSLGDGNPSGRDFRTLFCEQDFTIPGRYRLVVRFDDRPDPPTVGNMKSATARLQASEEELETYKEQLKDALGPLESNAESFEVVR